MECEVSEITHKLNPWGKQQVFHIYFLFRRTRVGRKVYRLESSYDDVISAVDDFFTNEIQALQHQRKKCVDCKGDYVEK